LLLCVGSCGIRIGGWPQVEYEGTVQQRASIAPGSTVVAETSFGSVSVAGADVADCNVIATICARAPTKEEAQELAGQVKIKLDPAGKTLIVRAEKPHLKRNRSISISYSITVPNQTGAKCSSSYGAVEFRNLNGDVNGNTSSGSIKGFNIQGSVQLQTSYGSVTCKDISGDNVKLKSGSGSITAESIKGSAELDTSYGSVSCKDFSGGDIKLKSSSGKITLLNASFGDCDAHTSYGSVRVDELRGKSIRLHSGSGSIDAGKTSADTIDVSTSYGRVTCEDIVCAELGAKSGSGNIDIVCAPSAPADMVAQVHSSYGNLDFVAPPDFAGQIELKTSYGSIKTALPVTVTGEITKKAIQGTIGQGEGKLDLQTRSGSIHLK
jgi:DUF4097 and DUF4098 domain-containing protein YvlB